MRDLVKILREMLASDALDRRCAAAMVAAEAKLVDKSLVGALVEALSPDNPVLSRYAMEAIVASGKGAARGAIPRLRELVGVAGIGEHAAEALAALGISATESVATDWVSRPPVERRAAAAILAQSEDAGAFDRLLEAMAANAEARSDAIEAIRSKSARIGTRAWRTRVARLGKFASRSEWNEHPEVREAAIGVVALAASDDAFKSLISWAKPNVDPRIRKVALSSLGRFHDQVGKNALALRLLLSCLDDTNKEEVVAPALLALYAVKLPRSLEAETIALLASTNAAVRHFAIRQLRTFVSPRATRRLVELLSDADPRVRELAAESLKGHPEVVDALVGRLAVASERTVAEVLTNALSAHQDRIKKGHIAKLCARALNAIEENAPAAEMLVPWVRSLNHEAFRELAVLGAERHRRAGRYREAARLLSQVLRDATPETKFAYFVCDWKTTPRSPVVGMRMGDSALRVLSEVLYAKKFNAQKAIRAERALAGIDLFTIAFAFSDGGAVEREFARDLLRHVATKYSKTKIGKHAKNKLRLLTSTARSEASDGDF